MNDADITKLAAKLSKSLASKDDLKRVEDKLKALDSQLSGKIDHLNSKVEDKLKALDTKLSSKIDSLNSKTDTILKFIEEVDKTTDNHEKRLKIIETIPAIAHHIHK